MKSLYYTKDDAHTYYRIIFSTLLAMYLLLVLTVYFDIAWYWVAILIGPALARWAIATHELFHIPGNHPIWVKAMPLPFSPINVGWKEHRAEHIGHHKHTANSEDPEWWRIGGGHIRAFIGCLFISEGAVFYYFKENGWKFDRWWIFRNVLFWGVFYLSGWAFVQFWLGLRIAYAFQDWVFNHILHYRGGVYGTYRVTLPGWLNIVAKYFYGDYTISATLFHDIHHKNPNIAAWNLEKAAAS